MIRGLLFLIIAVGLVGLIVMLFRRTRRPSEERPPIQPPAVAEVPPAALPPPAVAKSSAAPLGVDEVLHKLNELAFSRAITTSAQGHSDIITAVTDSLETSVTNPKYAPRRPMLLPQLVKAVSDTDTSRRELSLMI